MKLNGLFLHNFRVFQSLEVNLFEKTFLFGSNGAGKTTILEAIYMLCWGKSFRASRDSEVIRQGETLSQIEGEFKGEEFYNVKLALAQRGKKIVLNGKHISRAELIGKIPVLLLSPEELSMIDGPPKIRRSFLDRILSQMDSEYLLKYRSYLRLLKEKNAILSKSKGYTKLLELIDERMLKLAFYIWEKRKKFLDSLEDTEIYIKFKPSGLNLSVDFDLMRRTLYSYRDKEIVRGFSLFGPHLDEFEIMRNGISLKKYGSRGERKWVMWRIYLKALRALAGSGIVPIFLIDELLAELDSIRKKEIWKDLSRLDCQVIMTSLFPERNDEFIMFEVKNGTLKRYNS